MKSLGNICPAGIPSPLKDHGSLLHINPGQSHENNHFISAVSHLTGSRPSTASCTQTPTGVQRSNLAAKTENFGANLLNHLSTFHLSGKCFTLVTWMMPFYPKSTNLTPLQCTGIFDVASHLSEIQSYLKVKMNVNHRVRYMKKEILFKGIRIEVCSLKVPWPLCLKAVLALAYGLPAGVLIFMESSFSFMYFKKCTESIFSPVKRN